MKQVHKKGAVHALPVQVETLHDFRLQKKTCNAEWQWHRLSRTFTAYSLPVPSRLNGRRRNCPQFHPCWQVASHGLSNETSKWFSLIILKCKRFKWFMNYSAQALASKDTSCTDHKTGEDWKKKLAFAHRNSTGAMFHGPWDPPPSSCPNSKLSSFRPNLALDFEDGHVFFEMPSLLNPKKSTPSFKHGACCVLALFPPVEKHSWEEPSLNSRLPITPRGRFFNQSICLVIRAVGRWKKQTADFSVTVSSQFHIWSWSFLHSSSVLCFWGFRKFVAFNMIVAFVA